MAPPRLLAAVALVALVGAGCSNAPGSGDGQTPVTQDSSSTEPGSNAPGGTGGGGDQNAATERGPNPKGDGYEFARCMRENGVEDFPDPDVDGIIQYHGDPDPAEFTSAQENCRHLRLRPPGQNPGNGG